MSALDSITPEQWDTVTRNLGLVHWWVNRLGLTGTLADDAISAGTMALARAAASFDPERGFQFSTYAVVAIRRQVALELRAGEPVLSLDHRYGHEGEEDTLADFLADRTDLEGDAVLRRTLAEAIAALRAQAIDALDHTIIDRWLDTNRAIAAIHQVDVQTVGRRRKRLQVAIGVRSEDTGRHIGSAHGTYARYIHGKCRCVPCRAASRDRQRSYRARKAAA